MSEDIDRRTAISVGLALVALIAIVAAAIALASGDGSDDPSADPVPAAAPSDPAPPAAGGLPPGIAECLVDQGFELESPDQLHSVPEEVLEECFNALHESGMGP